MVTAGIFALGVLAGGCSLLTFADSRRQLRRQNDVVVASERLLSSVEDIETSYGDSH